MNKVGIISLGCAKNTVDSEVMLGTLKKKGYEITNKINEADTIIINTCGFIDEARKESREAILEVLPLKKENKRIVITGCMSERYKNSLKYEFPDVDVFLGVNDVERIVDILEKKQKPFSSTPYIYSEKSPRLLSTPKNWTYIKIAEGCSHSCSFCSIPSIKGDFRSRTIDSIVREAEILANRGIKEINLISQDTTSYGRDLALKHGLLKLLKKLSNVKGIEWIRILYGYPDEVYDSLLDTLKEEKICPYLDIPVQHSEEKILKKMGRGMDGKKILKFLEKVRKEVPDIVIRTSIIVGFPGEGENEFSNLIDFIKEARFDRLGVFTYSKENGTKAEHLGDPIPKEEKMRRKNILLRLQKEISLEKNATLLGKEMKILIEGTSDENPNYFIGRTKVQAPEVDGYFYARKNRFIKKDFLTAKVEKIGYHDLFGKIIGE
ncbi:MAG: 30S ribosomal protein S12 methylthiotransferase RimO [Acidobacteriota bacterium]